MKPMQAITTRDARITPTDVTAALSRWYAANSSIRRLLAVDDASAITIFVALEPSPDGDDALPLWLANARAWGSDLTALIAREVRLELLEGAALPMTAPGECLAHLDWRDAWH